MDGLGELFKAISIYQAQYDQVNTLWNYFSVVSLAVIGFVMKSDKALNSIKEPLAIVVSYVVFCMGNHVALVKGQEQLYLLGEIVVRRAQQADLGDLGSTVGLTIKDYLPIEPGMISLTHYTFIFAISAGLLVISRIRVKSKDNVK